MPSNFWCAARLRDLALRCAARLDLVLGLGLAVPCMRRALGLGPGLGLAVPTVCASNHEVDKDFVNSYLCVS